MGDRLLAIALFEVFIMGLGGVMSGWEWNHIGCAWDGKSVTVVSRLDCLVDLADVRGIISLACLN